MVPFLKRPTLLLPVWSVCFLAISSVCFASDWPMWRCTPERSAATEAVVPERPQVLWKRSYSQREPTWDDPLNLDLMTYDRVFEPIVLDGRLFMGFNDRDKLVALDASTGEELWSFYTEGPVRLPPAGGEGLVYFCSDDGHLYCVGAEDGLLRWKFRGAPDAQHALGNERLTSAWPARGGPVLRDGNVYFAASIWPFMGTFLYALDARSGEVVWINDSTGAQFIQQPHSAPSFAGVAPQGALVATEDYLLVPGGRSVPAVFDRSNGALKYFELNAGGKGTGGSFVVANDESFFVHTRLKGTREFKLDSGLKTAFMPNEPVLHGGLLYSAEVDRDDRPVVRASTPDGKPVWEVAADGSGDLILAGQHLCAAGGGAITAIRLPQGEQSAEVAWSVPVEGQIERLLAADGKLFAVTLEGDLLALGEGGGSDAATHAEKITPLEVDASARQRVEDLLAGADAQGYAFWIGAADEALVDAAAFTSPFVQIAVVDSDAERIDRLRRRLDAAGLYGKVTAHHAEPVAFKPPRYVAHLVVIGREMTATMDAALIRNMYEAVRPYGGVLQLLAEANQQEVAALVKSLDLEQAQVQLTEQGVLVRREGALPGSADWTHQYGDVANTIKSDDSRVKLPLGILWFGGSSNLDVLPRHGHGPPEQVVGGRLFIQGMNSLSARDVYTGRVLWKREFDNLGTFDVYFDDTYEDTPLDPKYNQVHIPGANGRGTNYVVASDRIYIIEGPTCHVLDPATGQTLQHISIAGEGSGSSEDWGYIGVYEDILIGGRGFARYRERHELSVESDAKLSRNRAGFGAKSFDRAASAALVGFNRYTGERLWTIEANHSFWHNGIIAGGGRVYCLDRNPAPIEDVLKRRGKARPDTYRILAVDAKSGERLWEIDETIFGTWLGYSAEQDVLLQAGASASDRLAGEVGEGMAVYSAADGSVRWHKESLKYSGPCILHNDLIITNANSYSESAGAFRLTDGEPFLMPDSITGELRPWKLTRAYGCNTVIASENLLTFRSGAAGFYDLLSHSGTGNFGGFKSGCTSNLVVANGVLNAPDYTRTCSCAYQNQTSLALVHMPDVEMWSISGHASIEATNARIRRLGINFGAPGDRRDDEGLMWLEYPVVAGDSPPLHVTLNSEATPYRHHSSRTPGAELPWILASGVTNVSDLKISMNLQEQSHLADGIPLSHAADDAEESPSGAVDLSSSDLELVDDDGAQIIGLRFENLALARGATIRSAHIQFTCDETSDGAASLLISAQDAGNAIRFREEPHDLSSRPRTPDEVVWTPGPWSKVDEAKEPQRTPDLVQLVQAVINRSDWEPGNAIAFLISGSGKRVARANKGGAARLIIDADQTAPQPATATPATPYRVRLFFAAPASPDSARQSFQVLVQGQPLEDDIELDPTGPPEMRQAIRTINAVPIGEELHVQFIPREGIPTVSGIEILSENP